MFVRRVLDGEYLSDTGELRRLSRNRIGFRGEHRNGDLGTLNPAGTGYRLRRAGIELRAIMLGDDQNLCGHQINPFFFNASTNSAASFTRTPF